MAESGKYQYLFTIATKSRSIKSFFRLPIVMTNRELLTGLNNFSFDTKRLSNTLTCSRKWVPPTNFFSATSLPIPHNNREVVSHPLIACIKRVYVTTNPLVKLFLHLLYIPESTPSEICFWFRLKKRSNTSNSA